MLYDNTIFSLNETRDAIREFLSSIADCVYLNEEIEFKLKIIINELVTNSLKYSKPSNYVRVLAKLHGTFISIAVIDDGIGFDYSKYRDVDISEENYIMKEGGRGIHIVDVLSDVLRYNRKGNIIAIKVNLV
jgi:anti-sigma regulatory factor (Ser/Thr protein kinase)